MHIWYIWYSGTVPTYCTAYVKSYTNIFYFEANIDIYIYIYIYIEKATASAADLWDPRLGCFDAWMLVFLLAWPKIRDEFELHFGVL